METTTMVAPLAPENRFHLREEFFAGYANRTPPFGPLGAVVHARTYADEDEGGRLETWAETCRRCIEGMFGYLRRQVRATGQHVDPEGEHVRAEQAFDLLWRGLWTPPGRGLEHMGRRSLEIKGGAILNNCGFRSTRDLAHDFAGPFCDLMDFSMLGVGMGFDCRGAGQVALIEPRQSTGWMLIKDSREGWIEALRALLMPFVDPSQSIPRYDYTRLRPAGAPLKTLGKRASGPGPLCDLLTSAEELLHGYVGRALDSAGIVDLMTLIGRCVVSGQRRSAEIALGDPDDAGFAGLKDQGSLAELYRQRAAIEAADGVVGHLDETIAGRRAAASQHSPLSPEYLLLQQRIAEAEAERREVCEALPGWAEVQAQIDAHPLNHHRWAANNSLLIEEVDLFDPVGTAAARSTVATGEPGYSFLGNARTRGRFADPPDDRDARVLGVNPCGEQVLEDRELCTLVETYPGRAKSYEEWTRALKWAHLYGVVVTTIPTHAPATNAVMARNRRIGTSVTGVWELYERLGAQELRAWLDSGYRRVRELNRSYSGWMGIPESVRVTTVKPSGTVSLLFGVEGGMKVPSARYYMRTVRLTAGSPLAAALARAGYRVEAALREPGVVVAYFPCESTARRFAGDVSVWEQASVAALLQEVWSDNAVSATLTFRPEEAPDVERVIDLYAAKTKGLAFLPLVDHGYPQAPYIPCTREEFEAARAALRPVDFSRTTHEVSEAFCDGGACEVRAA